MAFLEIACFQPGSAVIAAREGADRIELCAEQKAGGVSPPADWLPYLKGLIKIPIYVMVRPRAGNFVYSDGEFEVMKAEVEALKSGKADGVVFGILTQDNEVDVSRTTELVQLAHPLPCTFHRAFDETSNQIGALEAVLATGCKAVLTSGGANTAEEGAMALRQLVGQARDRGISIIVGGGVRSGNLNRLRLQTGATAFHSAAITDHGELVDSREVLNMKKMLASFA